MSILLESLTQKQSSEQGSVPNVHAQHFDDEMMGDEWLVKRIRIWRATAIVLLLLLLASWTYFWLAAAQSSALLATDTALAPNAEAISESTSETKTETTSAAGAAISQSAEMTTGKERNTEAKFNAVQKEKTVYKPQKREIKSVAENASDERAEETSVSAMPVQQSAAQGEQQPQLLEELPLAVQAEFPQLDIGSYVLSEDLSASFVILDGIFFTPDQVISPDLILREINTDEIIVEFKGLLVKLPHQ